MLASKDLFSELETIDKVRDGLSNDFEKAMLKIGTLQIKLLQSIRSNQVAQMKNAGIKLQESVIKTADTNSN